MLAQWEDNASSVTLLREMYSPEFRSILISTVLRTRARGAIQQAIRLDASEAPRREREQRNKAAAAASAAHEKTRATNKAAFRP